MLQRNTIPADAPAPAVDHRNDLLGRVVRSAAIWLLYVPHLMLVRVLGPKWGMTLVRIVARLHYAFTFLGFQRASLKAIQTLHPYLESPDAPRQILLRHLEFKHACFVELRLYAMRGWTQPPRALKWIDCPADYSLFEKLMSERNGLIIAGYHFGYFRQACHLAPKIHPGYTYCQVRYGTAQHQHHALSFAARLAARMTLQGERNASSSVYYLTPGIPPLDLTRKLAQSQVLMIAADGMISKDFVDVPFLNGQMRMPCGWARLAGITGSPVVIMCDFEVGDRVRELRVSQVLRCKSKSDADVHAAVAVATAVLESYIKDAPWAWHPWHRLTVQQTDNGLPLYILSPALDAADVNSSLP